MRFFGCLMAAALFGLAMVSGTAAADKQLHVNALANGTQCWLDDQGIEVCEQLALEVLSPAKGLETAACLTIVTTVGGEEQGTEEGCADAAGALSMDVDGLSAATLAPVAIDLYGYVCEGKSCDLALTRTVTLSADWTASAPKQRINERLYDHQPGCDVTVKAKGFARDASATIALDGAPIAGAGNLQWLETVGRCA